MLVTINTDASFHPIHKYGAYAFWAVCNEFKITKSGVFRKVCTTPDDAEAKCIINALTVVFSANKNITKVIVNTDSLNAIAFLTDDKEHIKRYGLSTSKHHQFREAFRRVKRFSKDTKIEFRHVRAHTGAEDKRSYVNEWCDAEAKKQLRQHILNQKNQ
jgi:ribonuclease HI